MTLTRDDLKWWGGILGGLVIYLAAHQDTFTWLPVWANHAIEFGAVLAAVISGKLATSPLPGK